LREGPVRDAHAQRCVFRGRKRASGESIIGAHHLKVIRQLRSAKRVEKK